MTLIWTRFSDCHSGGGRKTEYDAYHIQAPSEELAIVAFEAYTRLDAHHTTCDCCGPDWSIYQIDEGDAGEPWSVREDTLILDWATITDSIEIG